MYATSYDYKQFENKFVKKNSSYALQGTHFSEHP